MSTRTMVRQRAERCPIQWVTPTFDRPGIQPQGMPGRGASAEIRVELRSAIPKVIAKPASNVLSPYYLVMETITIQRTRTM
ncbi:hypothetical protein ABW17_21240 [Mycobacterium nebraskense]|nr:hypothetical protein ABW17_21240 [Mycobacterium nebraskense]